MTGMIAAYPVGGVFWDYVQYALALERLGFEVFYLEDAMMPSYVPEEADYDYEGRWERSAAYLEESLGRVSPALGRRWHFRGMDDRCFGIGRRETAEIVAEADVFLNVSGCAVLRDEYLRSPNKVLVDTDPGWNHFMRWPRADRESTPWDHGYRAHDRFFTYAERLGADDCPLPDLGLGWRPTRPPVLPDLWAPEIEPGERWTTVLSWNNAPEPIVDDGVTYGTKELEFARIEDLPGRLSVPLEIAAGGNEPPVERWRDRGWRVVDAPAVSGTSEAYRDYVHRSRGELSVAKHVYAATRSGWFSCRSTCYLASGRPVVLQDTGWSEGIPTGEGLFAFRDGDEAVAAVEAVEEDHSRHAEAGRKLAAEHFDGERVLSELLDRAGVNG